MRSSSFNLIQKQAEDALKPYKSLIEKASEPYTQLEKVLRQTMSPYDELRKSIENITKPYQEAQKIAQFVQANSINSFKSAIEGQHNLHNLLEELTRPSPAVEAIKKA